MSATEEQYDLVYLPLSSFKPTGFVRIADDLTLKTIPTLFASSNQTAKACSSNLNSYENKKLNYNGMRATKLWII